MSKELLEKFKRLYQEQFNIVLTDEEATKAATDLINLMKVLLKKASKSDDIKERSVNETYGAIQY